MTSAGMQKVQAVMQPLQASAKEGLQLEATVQTLNKEVKSFVQTRRIRRRTWASFIFMSLGNLLGLFVFVAPGWGWTHELNGDFRTQGEYYGIYGIWYTCWDDIHGGGRRVCARLSDYQHLSAWAKMCQGLAVVELLFGFVCFTMLGAYMCVPVLHENMKLLRGFVATIATTALVNTALFAAWGATFLYRSWWCCDPEQISRQLADYGLSYCFGLSVAGAFGFAGAAITGSFEMARIRRQNKYDRQLGLESFEPEELHMDPRTFFMVNKGYNFN